VFRVQINGEVYTVSLEQEQRNQFKATLDNVTFQVEATSNGETTTWLVETPSDRVHAHAKTLPNDRVDVWLACIPFSTKVQAVGTGGYSFPPEVRRRGAASQVRALMPGRITSVLVKEEESIKEGAPLLILEAMKMQNEITSPTNGKIGKILVHEGDTVKKDSVLIVIK
jgi:biotin carboxyl carrier protein